MFLYRSYIFIDNHLIFFTISLVKIKKFFMLLSQILDGLEVSIQNYMDFNVESVESDSRLVKDNSIFVAIDGITNRGIDFVDAAIKNGAKAIVIEDKYDLTLATKGIVIIKCASARDILVSM